MHLIGFLDTTAANKNPADPRNWAGGGRRSIANMFIDLGYSVALTEEQFQAEMAKRRAEHEEPQRLRHRLPAVLGAAGADNAASTAQQQGAISSDGARGIRSRRAIALAPARCCRSSASRSAQTRFTYSSGQSVSPAYEGWMPNADGSFTLYFGYMNTNWLAGVRHPDRPGRTHRAGRTRSGAADAFLSAPQPVPLHDSGAEGFRQQRADLDADDATARPRRPTRR